MCNPVADLNVVGLYVRVAGTLCDAELRSTSGVMTSYVQGQPAEAGASLGDSRVWLGIPRFVAAMKLSALQLRAQLEDELARYGEDGLDALQRGKLEVVRNIGDNIDVLVDFNVMPVTTGFPYADDPNLRVLLQATFFMLLTYSNALREVVCCRESHFRLAAHSAFGPPALVHRFFEALAPLTESYRTFALSDKDYVHTVQLMSRTGLVMPTPSITTESKE
jgi:hypothetical protein